MEKAGQWKTADRTLNGSKMILKKQHHQVISFPLASRNRRLQQASTAALLALTPMGSTTGFVPPAPTAAIHVSSRCATAPGSMRPLWDTRSVRASNHQSLRVGGNSVRLGRQPIATSLANSGLAHVLALEGDDVGPLVGGIGSAASSANGRRGRMSVAALRAVSNSGGGGGNSNRSGSGQHKKISNTNNNSRPRRSKNGYGYAPARGAAAAARGGGGEGGVGETASRGGERRSWRTAGDIPGLVLGVGMLATRHRREVRAERERQQAVSNAHAATEKDEEEEVSAVGVGLTGAGAGLGSRRAAVTARRSSSGGGRDGGTWEDSDSRLGEEEEEEGEEDEWAEAEEEVGAERGDAQYRRADVVRETDLDL